MAEQQTIRDVPPPEPEPEREPDASDLDDPRLYNNRELSWIEFNARVLELAEQDDMPLMERLKFLAIFTSNLDEFFTIRVAGLHDQVDAGLHDPGPDGRTPSQVIDELRERILELDERQTRCSQGEVRPALAEHGIRIVGHGRGRPRRARRAQRALPAPDLPRPHAAGGRSRAPVPLHLQPVAVARRPRARPADAGDDLRAREGAQGDAAALRPRGRGHRPSSRSSSSSRPTSTRSSPGWRSSTTASSASRATPTSTSPTRPTTCCARSRPSCAGGASARSCASRSTAR